MIIVDSSAIIAMMLNEPGAAVIAERLAAVSPRLISAASYVEIGTVLAGRRRSDKLKALDDLDTFLAEVGIEVEAVTAAQGHEALRARIRYGRGMGHGGKLNFGDAFSYALAKALDAPLLFIGNDFGLTDVKRALE